MSLMEDTIRSVPAGTYQVDEFWCFVGKKDKMLTDAERSNPEICSQFIFVPMDRDTKLVPCFRIGKRTTEVAFGLMDDLHERIAGRPKIITDGFSEYVPAVLMTFHDNVDFAQLIKAVREPRRPVREGYAPAAVVRCTKRPIVADLDPAEISTSLIERQNLTIRMSMRRLTRLTNAFSKKLDNLKTAAALHFAYYNFCRVHSTLRMTPVMAAGISDAIWDFELLLA